MPMQYTEIFLIENFQLKNFAIFLIFAQNIDCGYTYPQSMFWSKNKKNRYTPANPGFTIYLKRGVQGGIHCTDMFS